MSTKWDDFYIQKLDESTKWVEIYENEGRDNYTEISVDSDSNGLPVVILKRVGYLIFLKLTENMSFKGKNQTNITIQHSSGYWKKINGTGIFSKLHFSKTLKPYIFSFYLISKVFTSLKQNKKNKSMFFSLIFKLYDPNQ